jgi:hypothetical protein
MAALNQEMAAVEFPAKNAMGWITVTIAGSWHVSMRYWIACKMIVLASYVAPFKIEIESTEEES